MLETRFDFERYAALGIVLLVLGACSCEKHGRLVDAGEPGEGGIPWSGWGGDPFGSGGSGGVVGEGGAGGEEPELRPCEVMCEHVEGTCGLEVPGIGEECVAGCEEFLLDQEIACLSGIACSQAEVEACLGIEAPHRCEEICPFVYGECGKELFYGSTSVAKADCESLCPLLDPGYLDCMEAAEVCPDVDRCNGVIPPCERMCSKVYDICEEVLETPEEVYETRQSCLDACDDGAFTEVEIDCVIRAACDDISSCFETEPTECELFCGKVYGECHNAFPIGAHLDDKIDEESCVQNCEAGMYTEQQRACLMQESCEHAATCIYPTLQRSCAAACYWVHAYCGAYVSLQRLYGGIPIETKNFEAEYECHQFCENGYTMWDDVLGPHSAPPWSPARRACYGQRAQYMEPGECDISFAGLSYCNQL